MTEYLGNTFSEIERAIKDDKKGITLNAAQMRQVIAEQAALIEKNNDLVREIERLKRGDFTPEEFQNLCHHRDEKPGCTALEFMTGCAQYQVFGELHDGPPLTLPREFGELKD